MRRLGLALAATTILVTGCGGGGDESTPDTDSSAPATPEASETSDPTDSAVDDAEELADQVQAAVPEVNDRVTLTEDNDENDLIGRPGQYDQAVFLADERLGCDGPTYNNLSIDCGVKVERWPDADAAQARVDDIQTKLEQFGLGAEYDYVVGRLVLRVAGDTKPSDAAAFEQVAEAAS